MLFKHNTCTLRSNNRSGRTCRNSKKLLSAIESDSWSDQPAWLDPSASDSENDSENELYSTETASRVVEILHHKNCPQDLLIDVEDRYMNAEFIEPMMKALQNENSANSLQLYFGTSNDEISYSECKAIAEMLKNKQWHKDLVFDFADTSINKEGSEQIVSALLGNTSVIEMNMDLESKEQLNIIRHCVFRNQLIREFPLFESFIKEISFRNGLYTPGITPISSLSLKCLTGSFLFFNKGLRNSVKKEELPEDLLEYLAQLDTIHSQLQPPIYK